jgi:hypothetical protein
LSANWICLDGVVVAVITPATGLGAPKLSKISVENVENLSPELHTEAFRNPPYGIVLEEREIQVCDPRSGYDVATRISPQIEALRWSPKGITSYIITKESGVRAAHRRGPGEK